MSIPERRPAPVVWINGFPGTGKLTVATALADLHPDAMVIDDHKLIDPVEKRFPRSHPEYQEQRQAYRQAVFDEYVCNKAFSAITIIFTDFQTTSVLGRSVATEFQDAALRAGRLFIPVYLTCDLGVNLARVNSLDRVNGRTGKLTDVETLREMRERCELYRFAQPFEFTVDTTNSAPDEVAENILDFLEDGDHSKKVSVGVIALVTVVLLYSTLCSWLLIA